MLNVLLLNWLLVACSTGPTSYHAVVVDATDNKPLAGVTVENLKTKTTLTSDKNGRVVVESAPVRLRLNRIGYASLDIDREGTTPQQPDTLRLLPKALVLDNVMVRPAQQLRLTPVELDARHKNILGLTAARGLTPGSALAVLHRPPDTTSIYRVTKLIVGIPKQHEAEAGRLRVRLVNVVSAPASQPGPNDLLPVAAVFTAKQVNAAPNHELEVDVSAYGLRLPKQGLCVVVECLPTEPNETRIGINRVGEGSKLRVEVITATDPKNPDTYQRTSVEKFIWISTAHSTTSAITWHQGKTPGSWVQNLGLDAKLAPKTAPVTNALLDMVVEPE